MFTHRMPFHLYKKREILLLLTTWITVENTTLRETSQAQKQTKYCKISLICKFYKFELIKATNRMVVIKIGGDRVGRHGVLGTYWLKNTHFQSGTVSWKDLYNVITIFKSILYSWKLVADLSALTTKKVWGNACQVAQSCHPTMHKNIMLYVIHINFVN